MAANQTHLRLTVTAATARFLQECPPHFILDPQRGAAVVGRAAEADIQLKSQNVSRRHAIIEHDDGQWQIRDLGSKAGTRLNQAIIFQQDSQILRAGDQLQFGPIVLTVDLPGGEGSFLNSWHGAAIKSDQATIVAREIPGSVTAIAETELAGLAQQRLNVLLESAARLTAAADPNALAMAITQAATDGTSSPRALLIETTGDDEWTILGQHPIPAGVSGDVEISRSLVATARQGRTARLTSDESPALSVEAPSLISLNIQSAICTPLVVDDQVEAVLYLDTRSGEQPIQPDAAEYCVALAHLGGMALGNLRRAELARKERELRDELVAARTAQQLMIPASAGELGPVRYALEAVPGTIVAGDLFDIVRLSPTSAMVILGDVMGKGAAAGMMMATVQTYFRTVIRPDVDLSRMFERANEFFVDRFLGQGFVTLWMGLFDSHTRRVSYVDAGHGHWQVFRPQRGFQALESEGGPPLGALADSAYAPGEIDFGEGDRILLYSDGLVEQLDRDSRVFGETDAWNCLSESRSAVEDVQRLVAAHSAFRGSVPLADDLTVASLEPTYQRRP